MTSKTSRIRRRTQQGLYDATKTDKGRNRSSSLLLLQLLLSLYTFPSIISAQEYVSNVISTLSYSSGCINTGSQLGKTNLYDGTTSNYWCPTDKPNTVPSLIIESNGPSIITKLRVYAPNTESGGYNVGYDPTSYKIEGLIGNGNDGTGLSVIIAQGYFNSNWVKESSPPPARNTQNNINIQSTFESGDVNLSYTEIIFNTNRVEYTKYRVTFPTTRLYDPTLLGGDGDDIYRLEIAELELVGELKSGSPTYVSACLLENDIVYLLDFCVCRVGFVCQVISLDLEHGQEVSCGKKYVL